MTYDVDTVIIGGGPAGAACGICLQKRQISSIILEKNTFPRAKTCGGLMTEKTVALLKSRLLADPASAETLQRVFCDSSSTVELWDRGERLTRSKLQLPLRSTRRIVLDSFLIDQYRALGGTLLEGETAYRLEPAARRIVLRNQDEIRYRRLVAADGALSKTRTALGCRQPTLGFCVETYVPKTQLPDADAVRICFGVVPTGYVWVFPSGSDFCIGLGGVYDKAVDYPAILRDYLSSLGLDPNAQPIKGAFVPIGTPVKQTETPPETLLIGDAGGFVDPLYGEGLYFALRTGVAAADAIADGRCKSEFRRLTAPVRAMIRQGVFVQKVFFRPAVLRGFCRRIRQKNAFVGYYCDNQLSTYRYAYAALGKLRNDYKRRNRSE